MRSDRKALRVRQAKSGSPQKTDQPRRDQKHRNSESDGAAIAARDGSRACDSAASINNPVAALEEKGGGGGGSGLGRIAVGASRKA